jgi:acyl-CoA thioesterase
VAPGTAFDSDTAIRPLGDGAFEASVSESWQVLRGPHGGYLAAILLRALEATLGDPARQVRSLTIHYPKPPEPGPVRIDCRVERSGRSLSTLSARMEQGGRTMALALAAFSVPWPEPVAYALPAPEVAAAEEIDEVPWVEGMPAFRRHLDFRPVFGDPFFSGSDRALVGGWLRTYEPHALDAPYVAMIADAWAPAPFPVGTVAFGAPTIDLTIHFRSPLPPAGSAPGDFLLGRFESLHARDGFFEEDGAVWTPAGELVCQSRQLALTIGM